MNTTKMLEGNKYARRGFLRTTSISIAAVELGMINSTDAQSSETKPADLSAIKPGTYNSLGMLKQIDADGSVVFLLRGWPCDIRSHIDVTPLLASAGCHWSGQTLNRACSRRLLE